MTNWIKSRLLERTSYDGAGLIVVGLIILFFGPLDDMFGKKAQFDENMGLSKKFFSIYKKLEAEGDTTAKNVYKDGSEIKE